MKFLKEQSIVKRLALKNMSDILKRLQIKVNRMDISDKVRKEFTDACFVLENEFQKKNFEIDKGSSVKEDLQDALKEIELKDEKIFTLKKELSFLRGEEIISDKFKFKKNEILKDKEYEYKTLFGNSEDTILILENDKIVACNNLSSKMYGYQNRYKLQGLKLEDLSPDYQPNGELSSKLSENMLQIALKQGIHHFEWNYKRLNGEIFRADVWLTAMDIDEKRLIHTVVRDIFDQKSTNDQLKESNRQLSNTINNLQDVYYKTDFAGKLIMASPSICRYFDCSGVEDLIGQNIGSAFYKNPQDREIFLNEIKEKGRVSNYPIKFVDKNNKVGYGELNSVICYDTNNSPHGIEGIIRDVTDRVKNERELKQLNEELTASIESIEKQNNEIATQKEELQEQTDIVTSQQEQLTDSILYAKKIQDSLLPKEKILKKNFDESFIFYRASSIVSGDFYYFTETKKYFILVAADCTGHGVPGGFMTMLGLTLLREIAKREEVVKASQVLDIMREKVKYALKQEETSPVKDGMDVSFCAINKETLEMQYAGAINPLVLIQNGELKLYKADRMPVGVYYSEKPFTNHTIQLNKGDSIYLFSDGYTDQFNGVTDKKFTSKRFRKYILEISGKHMDIQKQLLENTFDKWRGDAEQIDDVLIMGVKI